ncbi:hypothetical protein SCP_0313520 [Sparassis crispa]|uniref:Dual specificity phosphatase catalytic domain-containing protein n=1 Tax=Sparassis crispa TaxID=139825 RepID=A0A401GHM7_9APHY|nr:hypothetical protein SCP_0313520 [Sparassis crispa]GBE81623.1 hypothetical protein SCP_0313520 [Sparassis crispa]
MKATIPTDRRTQLMYSKFAARTPSPLRSEIMPGEEPQKPSTRRTHSKSSARSEQRKSRATSTRTSSLDDYQPHACEIVPGFLVSDTHTATSPEILDELGVTHMISLMRDGEPSYTPDINHVCIPIDVTAQSKLIQSFDCAVVWIATAMRARGTVLVHCMWGTSRTTRSPSSDRGVLS